MTMKMTFTTDDSAKRDLSNRSAKQKRSGPPLTLDATETAVHFLRGVHSRATLALPAFYLFHGASLAGDQGCAIQGYAGTVLVHTLKFSSLGTISLACRKAFDHKQGGLTGHTFAGSSNQTLLAVAEYWAKKSRRPPEDALAALSLLRIAFADCAKTDTDLFNGTSTLGRRIGLLKQYADRSAAHLSLGTYEFSIIDCAHVIAVLVLVGEIIRSFDGPVEDREYFDRLDAGSLSAARQLFPATPDLQLFKEIKVEAQARLCWQWGIDRGRHMLLEQLPYAISWF
jgi:hypothetical protein